MTCSCGGQARKHQLSFTECILYVWLHVRHFQICLHFSVFVDVLYTLESASGCQLLLGNQKVIMVALLGAQKMIKWALLNSSVNKKFYTYIISLMFTCLP